jgi:tetratricopeptide (TPR) repeat protein
MNDQPRNILIKLLSQHDLSYFQDSNQFRNVLNDFFKGQNKKESRILTDSFKQNIPQDLLAKNNSVPYEILSVQLVHRLVNFGFAGDLAKWAVDSWALSLKIIKEEDLSPKTALLFITSNPPDAELIVNDEKKGKTPKELTNLSPGSYEVKIELNGYQTYQKRFDILKEQKITINANLIKEKMRGGDIFIDSSPQGAAIFIDSNPNGVTPKSIYNIEPGLHEIKLQFNGYQEVTQQITVQSRKNSDFFIQLNPKPSPIPPNLATGEVSIDSNPSHAYIMIDSVFQGSTPKVIKGLKPGIYPLHLKLDGYEDVQRPLEIRANKRESIFINFSQVRYQPTVYPTTPSNPWLGKIVKGCLLLFAGLVVFLFISILLSNISNPVTTSQPIPPDNAAQSYNTALNLLTEKKYEEALIAFDNTLAIDPTNANAWTNKGNILLYLNRSDEALIAYTKALSISPNLQSAIDGMNQVQQKRHIANLAQIKQNSLTQIQESIEKGESLADEGKYQEAINSYDQGLTLIGDDKDIEKIELNKRLLSLKVFALNKLGMTTEANKIAQTISHF